MFEEIGENPIRARRRKTQSMRYSYQKPHFETKPLGIFLRRLSNDVSSRNIRTKNPLKKGIKNNPYSASASTGRGNKI